MLHRKVRYSEVQVTDTGGAERQYLPVPRPKHPTGTRSAGPRRGSGRGVPGRGNFHHPARAWRHPPGGYQPYHPESSRKVKKSAPRAVSGLPVTKRGVRGNPAFWAKTHFCNGVCNRVLESPLSLQNPVFRGPRATFFDFFCSRALFKKTWLFLKSTLQTHFPGSRKPLETPGNPRKPSRSLRECFRNPRKRSWDPWKCSEDALKGLETLWRPLEMLLGP